MSRSWLSIDFWHCFWAEGNASNDDECSLYKTLLAVFYSNNLLSVKVMGVNLDLCLRHFIYVRSMSMLWMANTEFINYILVILSVLIWTNSLPSGPTRTHVTVTCHHQGLKATVERSTIMRESRRNPLSLAGQVSDSHRYGELFPVSRHGGIEAAYWVLGQPNPLTQTHVTTPSSVSRGGR